MIFTQFNILINLCSLLFEAYLHYFFYKNKIKVKVSIFCGKVSETVIDDL